MKNRLSEMLAKYPDFKKMYGDERVGLHVYNVQPEFPEEWNNFDEKEKHDRRWYYSICSFEEVNNIMNPKNSEDFLLKLRADCVFDNMRITRTIAKKALYIEDEKWTLKNQFDDSIFDIFRNEVNDNYSYDLDKILFGTIYSDKPKGSCIKNKFGIVIIISEALKYFLYFMNLFYYDLDNDNNIISIETKTDALLIALRTMMLYESFDFELDVRGNIPDNIDQNLKKIVNNMLLVIIAHEYAHILLNHFKDSELMEYKSKHDVKENVNKRMIYEYSSSKNKEYEADNFAIDILSGNNIVKQRMYLLYSIHIMVFLDIVYFTKNIVKNRPHKNITHPSSYKRLRKLLKRGKKIWNNEENYIANYMYESVTILKKYIITTHKQNPNIFNTYGSMYLRQWKDVYKKDRIDY